MNRYADLKQRQQQEFSAFPMQFAFSDQQFAEGMAALGLEPTDTDKIWRSKFQTVSGSSAAILLVTITPKRR